MSPPSEKPSGYDCRIERLGTLPSEVLRVSLIDLSTCGREEVLIAAEDRTGSSLSSSVSSIGENSDESSSGGVDGEEVQSEYKGGAFASLDTLEAVLPVKRSISKFYGGKSISFSSLSDAACCSMKDIAKPEGPHTRKRKNLLAYSNYWSKKSTTILSSSSSRGEKSKEPNNVPLCSGGETSGASCLPPLPPHTKRALYNGFSSPPPADNFLPWRPFSSSDLRGANSASQIAHIGIPDLRIKNNG